MYAIIKTGGKQYRVAKDDVIEIEKLKDKTTNDKVVFDQVLAVGEGADLKIGTPVVNGAAVEAEVVEAGKSDKVIVYKYKAKKDYRRKQGHRQPYMKVKVTAIEA
ncbi:ribosomal protein L21 [Pseudoramibacter alactolyticus ATCC 23263]|jgi:large subunit ribosomal protein L21|uniref:Large ribosomal subunit protein bL21 n=1 Tax=Pseudoramibacter alactolyticus ATCC 23263 TaxID=887929 RepID=E6MF20_9FIRM|nr:50S ribosomal protein L21 [Pseudoramibacter alactolyticus]EFV02370.1 ribosomal protein L21 [Pseudoramibacter alactolyticus ATCC 23263]MBM6967605.1 50S ribosomal protein L21 [Pseudoramibacter alactolyticus]